MRDSSQAAGAASSRPASGTEPERDAPLTTVFAPGEDRLTRQELRALSPQQTPAAHRSGAGLSQALIMMVDDEMLNIEMTQAFLTEAGYELFVQTDQPEQAIPMMRRQPPGVLLLDLSMPRVGGLDILASMQADPVLCHVPVIVLTSSTEPQVKLKALGLGAVDFLSKPVDPAELALRIRNTLAASAYREYLGHHDPLTELPNKQLFRRVAAEVLAQARSTGHAGAFLQIGVDGLGRINDALGRAVGDRLLQRIAKRLASCVQTEAHGDLASAQHNPTLYRVDGDEFAVIVPYMEGVHSAAAFINRLLEDGTATYHRHGAPEVFVTCSIGVSAFPADGCDPDVLMRNAGLALRHAKQAGPHRYEFFSPRFNELAQTRLDLGAELRHAIARDQLELLYEPRVELGTGQVLAAQALLRWTHPSGSVLEGDALMDLAGSSGMGVDLTEWLFEQLRRHARTWRGAGMTPLTAAIKVSLANLHPRDLGHLVQASIAAGIPARQLSLELQHLSELDALPARDAEPLGALRRNGVRLALDRFGTTASVGHLRKVPCDALHIDASLVRELEADALVRSMLLGLADLARRVGVDCVACGVDTAAQLAFLRKNGWNQAQGRVFGGPLGAVAFGAKFLARGGKGVRVGVGADAAG